MPIGLAIRAVAGRQAKAGGIAIITNVAAQVASGAASHIAAKRGEDSSFTKLAQGIARTAERTSDIAHQHYQVEVAHESSGLLRTQLVDGLVATTVEATRAKSARPVAAVAAPAAKQPATRAQQLHVAGKTAEHAGDMVKAAQLFAKSAEQAYPPAMNDLAYLCEKGIGVAQNLATAAAWHAAGARAGYAPSQHNYAACLYTGRGVPMNRAEAVQWLHKAAQQGYAPAKERLAAMQPEAKRQAQATRGSREWALHELELPGSADKDAINDAWKRLMKVAHSDRGGDDAWAADLNLARQTLLAALATARP